MFLGGDGVGFLTTLLVEDGFLSDSGCPIGSFITLLNWEFLLKWHNSF